jgi:hypothetical protein
MCQLACKPNGYTSKRFCAPSSSEFISLGGGNMKTRQLHNAQELYHNSEDSTPEWLTNEIVPGLVESGGSRLSARYATCTC